MIFVARLIIFSFLIFLGFWISVRSETGRRAVTVIYSLTVLWYCFLCRLPLFISTPTYGAATSSHVENITPSLWQRFIRLLAEIWGVQPDRTLAGGGVGKAMIFNAMLFIPLGFLLLLWIPALRQSKRGRVAAVLITAGVSIIIELTQSLTTLGMADWKDVVENTVGGLIGIVMVYRRSCGREAT